LVYDPRIRRVITYFSLFIAFVVAIAFSQYSMIEMLRWLKTFAPVFMVIFTNNMLSAISMFLGSMLIFRLIIPSFYEICSEGVVRISKLDCAIVSWGFSHRVLLASLLALSFIVGSSITSALKISAIYGVQLRPENIYSYFLRLVIDPLAFLYVAMEISAYFIAVHAARSRIEMLGISTLFIAAAAYIEATKIL
jgi:hypothetical protein